MTTRIILDNAGGLILQLGDWAHSYEGSTNADLATRAADDIREWLKTGATKGWEGNDADALAVAPTSDEIRNGGYRAIVIDRDSDTAASLADEVRWGAMGDALGDALADPSADARGIEAKIEERGNGFPKAGQYVACDGDLYRVVKLSGPIETSGVRGNWIRATVEEADWSDCAEGDDFPAAVVIGSF